MARRASFLYKIETDESNKRLLDKMDIFAKANKINFNSEHPWRGFIPQGRDGEVMQGVSRGVFYAAYGFERVKKIALFNGETKVVHLPYPVSVIIDPARRILALQTSDKTLAEDIFKLLQSEIEDANYIRLVPLEFEDQFLRWLVNNATRRGNGIFVRMSGVKLARLRDFDNELSDATLNGDDQISRSRTYMAMHDNVHKYVVGYANIDGHQYKVRIYDHGQITITVGDNTRIAPTIPVVAEEILHLQNEFAGD